MLHVEVVYALAQEQTVVRLSLAPGTTVQEAVDRSGIAAALPTDPPPIFGIFGRRVPADHPLVDGDQVEIYRPLPADPRSARRARAKRSRRTRR